MAGKDYSDEAYHIARQFDELVSSTDGYWQDEQATKFGNDHVEPIRKALSDIQLPIESIIDVLDTKLNEIRSIANG